MIDYQTIFQENEHLLDGLKAVQKAEGYLSEASLRAAAKAYGKTPNQVYETATFYSMLFTSPQKEHIVEVCGSTCCDAQKAEKLIRQLKNTLPEYVKICRCECLGRCDTAPNAIVDGTLLVNATCDKVADLLGGLL